MVDIKCNHLNYLDYKYLQGCSEPWRYLFFTTMLFPFDNLNNKKFLDFINNNDNNVNNNHMNNNNNNNNSSGNNTSSSNNNNNNNNNNNSNNNKNNIIKF